MGIPTPDANPTVSYVVNKSPPGTPKQLEEGDALRAGGEANLLSRQHIGLLAQYATLGMLNHTLTNAQYPFLFNYCRMSGVEVASTKALLSLIWTFKFLMGIVSDCHPIFGYRRRPYMVIGWFIVCASAFTMAVMPMPDPYYPVDAWATLKHLTAEQTAQLNKNAPHSGVTYLVLMVVFKFGMMIAIAAAEGKLVDLAQREHQQVRGKVVASTNMAKFMCAIGAAFLTGFGMNGPEYGGSFSHSMGFNAIMGVCAAFALCAVALSWFCIEDPRVTPESRTTVGENLHELYNLMQQRAVYQMVGYLFWRGFFSSFSTTAATPVKSLWGKVEPVADTVGTAFAYIIASATVFIIKRYGLGWSWRTIMVVMTITTTIFSAVPSFLTIWDVVRNQWLFLPVALHDELPQYLGGLVTSFAIVEIIEVGNEATTYGLLSTVGNLAGPFATVIYKVIDSHYKVNSAHLVEDTHKARSHAMDTYLIAYACNLFSMVFILWLPRQKAEMQELRRKGGKSKVIGIVVMAFLMFIFAWSLVTNCMTFSSRTSCYRIAGGTGCKKAVTK